MAKKKTTKAAPFLSPETYIRQRSRNLPIKNCWVNANWQESGLANLILAREHSNGNITSCLYLVDLKCLGVKDTMFRHNISLLEFDSFFEKMDENLNLEEISYLLAHNIIYAGLAFAEDYGLQPHKDFSSTTKYFLEEDTDDIPLIKIPCGGEDGKPLYIGSEFESVMRRNQVLSQLEKTAGKGNYHYILPVGEFDDNSFDEDDDFNEEMEERFLKIKKMSFEERKERFSNLYKFQSENFDDLSEEERQDLILFSTTLADDIADKKDIQKYFSEMEDYFDVASVKVDELPNGLFAGINNIDGQIVAAAFFDAYNSICQDEEKEKLKKFQKQFPEAPASDFLEMMVLLQNDKIEKFKKKLKKCYSENPDYLLFQIYNYIYLINDNQNDTINLLQPMKYLLLNAKYPVTDFETNHFFQEFWKYFTYKNTTLAEIIAFGNYIENYDCVDQQTDDYIFASLEIIKILQVADYLFKK